MGAPAEQGHGPPCDRFVHWWDGEYEGNCELPKEHDGDHWDGTSWFDDDNGCTDHLHPDEPPAVGP
jgi:hypothetical protein